MKSSKPCNNFVLFWEGVHEPPEDAPCDTCGWPEGAHQRDENLYAGSAKGDTATPTPTPTPEKIETPETVETKQSG